jgi:hypothetical protein
MSEAGDRMFRVFYQRRDLLAVIARLGVAPFECAIAGLLIVFGASTIFRWGTVNPADALLPAWETYVLAGCFAVSGALILAGVAVPSLPAETAGLLMLCATLICRLILYAVYLGPGSSVFILAGASYTLFIAGAFLRLVTMRRQRIIIEIRKGGAGAADRTRGSGPAAG